MHVLPLMKAGALRSQVGAGEHVPQHAPLAPHALVVLTTVVFPGEAIAMGVALVAMQPVSAAVQSDSALECAWMA